MYTTEIKNAITPSVWFYNQYNHSQKETDSNLPSRTKIAFLLDSSASILVSIIPTSVMINQMSIVRNHDQHDTSKILTIVNQCEVTI